MPTLPAHPNLDQLRHQAKDLLSAAQAGDADAIARILRVSERLTLAGAQLALAREYGFTSWLKLKDEVETRTLDLAQKVDAFCEASVRGRPGRAARMLLETPEIADYNFATAVILGDASRVQRELKRDPRLATRRDARTGWTALHAACASRWNQVDPARSATLAAVARFLINAGADPTGKTQLPPGGSGGWSPLRCVIASANSGPSNQPIVELLLAHGAVPDDHDLYLAGFAHDRHELLPLLLQHFQDAHELQQAFAAPISSNDVDAVRLLLDAGADPSRYRDDDGHEVPIVWAAIVADCDAELVELLLTHDAEPTLAGPDGRTPYRIAAVAGRSDLTKLLRRHGAIEDATPAELFVSACVQGKRVEAERQLRDDPALLARLDLDERTAIVRTAEAGNVRAVALMLDLGFPLETRGNNGATALHAAAYSGSPDTVQLLIDRGADIEARDSTWDSTPLDWAAVGSGERPTSAPDPDWLRTVSILLESGASTSEITLAPDDPKPPSPEVAALLQAQIDPEAKR